MKKIAIFLLLTSCVSMPTSSNWVLNNDDSTLSFISTKAVNIAEVHRFASLAGGVGSDGSVEISIDLGSVDTNIEIRDERMRGMLFDTSNYPAARITSNIDMSLIDDLRVGESTTTSIAGELMLHGQVVPLTFDVVVSRVGTAGLLVASERPVVVNAPQFGLTEGVERLREVAGLDSISTAVPVSFVLSFDAG